MITLRIMLFVLDAGQVKKKKEKKGRDEWAMIEV